jgi:hypothetical protein
MGAFSGFLVITGILTIFGSAMSLGLAFLHTMQGDSWAPLRTGPFLAHYIGVDFGVEWLFDWLGWGVVVQTVLAEPLYRVLFILGLLLIFLALSARGMSREA